MADDKITDAMVEARPLSEWHEDMGDVLWWRFPIVEPPYVGTPLDIGRTIEVNARSFRVDKTMLVNIGGWPGYHTHWTPISVPSVPASPVPCVSDEASETGESEG